MPALGVCCGTVGGGPSTSSLRPYAAARRPASGPSFRIGPTLRVCGWWRMDAARLPLARQFQVKVGFKGRGRESPPFPFPWLPF